MPKLVNRYPKCKLHKNSGRGRVRHEGKTYWMPGAFESPECLRGYADFIEKLKAGESPTSGEKPKENPPSLLTIAELIEKFWEHCQVYYRGPNGPTGEHANIKCALRPLLDRFPDMVAAEIRVRDIEEVRDLMIKAGWSRKYVNGSIGRIKRLFNWATEKEIVPAGVSGAIARMKGLQAFRSNARETTDVPAVGDDMIEATLAQLSPENADMVRVARLCGCRPGELINMNAAEIDRRDPDCWWYRPKCHKTAHRGHTRSIPINREAQAILESYVASSVTGKVFHFRHRDGLRQSIQRAIQRAFPHPTLSEIKKKKLTPKQKAELAAWHKAHRWTTNQVRHTALQVAKDIEGHDGAQALGGHRHSSTTDTYATATERRAKQVAQKMTLRPAENSDQSKGQPHA
jgi:integrase